MKRGGDGESLGDVLKGLVKVYGLERKFNELDAVEAWEQIMGKAIASKTRKIIVHQKTMVLYIDSGVLKEELAYSKEKIITLINEHVGKEVINKVEIY